MVCSPLFPTVLYSAPIELMVQVSDVVMLGIITHNKQLVQEKLG